MEVIIDNYTYIIEKVNIDFDKFDHEGYCKEYDYKSYVVIEDDVEKPRVRILNGFCLWNSVDSFSVLHLLQVFIIK